MPRGTLPRFDLFAWMRSCGVLGGVCMVLAASWLGCDSGASAEAREALPESVDRDVEAAKPDDRGAKEEGATEEERPAQSERSRIEDLPLREPTEWQAEGGASSARRKGARDRRRTQVASLFAKAGIRFPPRQLMFRAFKKEAELEVWAASHRGDRLQPIARYGICAASGKLGPKRREGDHQVPEGFYRVGFFNAQSSFHLSMLVSYPNRSDRVLSDPKEPGGEIMIHGSCVSAGCLAMSDERVEELWVMAREAAAPVHVHIFPARDIDALIAKSNQRQHHAFWSNLAEGKKRFERQRRLPKVRVLSDGRYAFSAP